MGPELPASASQVSSRAASASQVSASKVSAMPSGSASVLSTELGVDNQMGLLENDSARLARHFKRARLSDGTICRIPVSVKNEVIDGWKSEGTVGTANGIAELVKTVTKKVRRDYCEEDY